MKKLESYLKYVNNEKEKFKNKYTDEVKEEIEEILKAERALIVCSDKGSALIGNKVGLIGVISMTIRGALEKELINKSDIEKIVKYSLMSNKELNKNVEKLLK